MAELEEVSNEGLSTAEAQLIVSMRIYDVLMSLLTLEDRDTARSLNEIHSKGGFIGAQPFVDPEYLQTLQQDKS